ncbi:Carbonate dehydratase [Bertholletia excelsa]
MEKPRIQTLSCAFLLAFALLSVPWPAVLSQEVEDERDFAYEEDSVMGPQHWGDIRPEWRLCGKGRMQSPIDLLNKRAQLVHSLGELKLHYTPSNATLINRGHDISLKWEGKAGYLEINGTHYELKQCHWHSPSEHTVNGRRFDLEIHLVHESKNNQSAVIGILYTFGPPDSFLSQMYGHLQALANNGEESRVLGEINPKQVRISSRSYYRYIGSLTVPPCSEHVVWTIAREVRTVSREQVGTLHDAIHDAYEANARPIQPVNKRLVKFYRAEDDKN